MYTMLLVICKWLWIL